MKTTAQRWWACIGSTATLEPEFDDPGADRMALAEIVARHGSLAGTSIGDVVPLTLGSPNRELCGAYHQLYGAYHQYRTPPTPPVRTDRHYVPAWKRARHRAEARTAKPPSAPKTAPAPTWRPGQAVSVEEIQQAFFPRIEAALAVQTETPSAPPPPPPTPPPPTPSPSSWEVRMRAASDRAWEIQMRTPPPPPLPDDAGNSYAEVLRDLVLDELTRRGLQPRRR